MNMSKKLLERFEDKKPVNEESFDNYLIGVVMDMSLIEEWTKKAGKKFAKAADGKGSKLGLKASLKDYVRAVGEKLEKLRKISEKEF